MAQGPGIITLRRVAKLETKQQHCQLLMSNMIVRSSFDDTKRLPGVYKEPVWTLVLVAVRVVFDGFCEAFDCLVVGKAISEVVFKDVERTTVWRQLSNMGTETRLSQLECQSLGLWRQDGGIGRQ